MGRGASDKGKLTLDNLVNDGMSRRVIEAPSLRTAAAAEAAELNIIENHEEFFDGYVEAMFFTEGNFTEDGEREPLSFSDIAQETIEQMRSDCKTFETANIQALQDFYNIPDTGPSTAGHEFWMTRNGHGTGFFDADLGAPKEVREDPAVIAAIKSLEFACKAFNQCDTYVGDDGQIYV